MKELIFENKEHGTAGGDNQEQQECEQGDYFCPALVRAINGKRLAALRALELAGTGIFSPV